MANLNNDFTRSSYLLFFVLLFLTLMLEIVHLPSSIALFRPDFLCLLLIFFSMHDPKRINLGWAWTSGLLLDLLTGAPLGINGLALALQIYIIFSRFVHFSQFLLWQQALVIGIINFIGHSMVYWIEHLIGQITYTTRYDLQSLATIVAWPIVFFCCGSLWQTFKIRPLEEKEDD